MMVEAEHPEFSLGTNKKNCNKNKEGVANIAGNDQLSDSNSENLEDIEYDDEMEAINNGEGVSRRPSKKRYHRHTTHQIQEMERVFKECPHPDEKQRQELSRELKLSPRQIKFWFQNKRTQMKAHHERKDNGVLRTENEKLKAENCALRDAVRNVSCPTCGGPASVAEMSLEEQQLRIENVRLKEEIDRITNMVTKHIGRKNVSNGGGVSARGGGGGDGVTNNNASMMMMRMMMTGGNRASRGGRELLTIGADEEQEEGEEEGGEAGRGEMMMMNMMRMMRGAANNGSVSSAAAAAAMMYGGGGGMEQEEAMKHGGQNQKKNKKNYNMEEEEEEEEEEGEVEELGPTVAEIASRPLGLTEGEKPLVVELAVASMEELVEMARSHGHPHPHPLWVLPTSSSSTTTTTTTTTNNDAHHHHHHHHHQSTSSSSYNNSINADAAPDCSRGSCLDLQAYFRRFPRGIGPTPLGLSSEATRHSGLVIMNSASLVETFMDVAQWKEMFSSIISRARIVEVLSMGVAGTYDGAIQLMYAEFQIPTPLVPTRENYFLRYSKHVDHFWVVVDVSIDSLRGNPPPSLLRCRRRPSGCIIEEMPNGYSKVTWVENVEVDTKGVHNLYQSFVNSGMAFGAVRWLSTLQRQCERIASVLANNVPSGDSTVVPNVEGRRSMLKLAERMVKSFNGGVGSSTSEAWVTLAGNNCNGAEDVRVVIHKSNDEPGHPPGIVLSASTSLWLPCSPRQIFQFLRTDRLRSEWDILSNNGVIKEMFYIAKGPDPGNSVSLLRVNPINSNQSNMLILQECCTDEVCSLVVYAPIDVAAMSGILNGGDPDSVALLPSGFAILPDGPAHHNHQNLHNPHHHHHHHRAASSSAGGGSLLTLAFQILVDHVPTARLSLGSVATVNKLISNTVARIKSSLLSYENA